MTKAHHHNTPFSPSSTQSRHVQALGFVTVFDRKFGQKPVSVFAMSRKTKTTKSTRKTNAVSIYRVANPSLLLGNAPPQPTPVPVYTDKFVKRTYRAVLTTQTATKEVAFPPSVFNVPGKFFVDKLQVWKVGGSDLSVGIKATFKQGNFTDLGADDITATDYGSASSLPGVSCKVPSGHTVSVDPSANNLVVCAPVVPDPTTTKSATFVCNLHCWVAA